MKAEGKTGTADKLTKNKILLLLMAVLGLILAAAGGLVGAKTEKSTQSYTDVGFYTEYLEERISSLCRSVAGIEEAAVFLTIDCSSEYIYEKSGTDYLILSGEDGEEAVMLCEIYPKVRGIAVVCTGGDLPRVQETLTQLLCAALDLPANRIRIAGS
ncbi:MAG: hypothetical protein IJC71_08235 [Clostridia bacterium]|nr:hypothetical protein [Clostridia bacterium]